MSALEGGSIPPPGWDQAHPLSVGANVAPTPVAEPAPVAPGPAEAPVLLGRAAKPIVPDPTAEYEALLVGGGRVSAVAAHPATEGAVRWRMRAATVDNFVVYGLYLLVCLMLHWQVATLGHLVFLLVVGVAYHFALESRDGQTLGKRRYGIRVVSVNGDPAQPKAIAIRSVLRAIDALPFSYLSGLISMVRTGPERRQRIGDVVAETKVIAVDGRAASRGTAGWVLPAATLAAFAFSAFGVYAVVEAGHQPLTASQQAQFVAGCENSAHGAVDCQCLLNRLEADGYNTLDDLNSVVQQAANERLYGQSGAARVELVNDTTACLR